MTPDELQTRLKAAGINSEIREGQLIVPFGLKTPVGKLAGVVLTLMPRQGDVVDLVGAGVERIVPLQMLTAGAQKAVDEPFMLEYRQKDDPSAPGAVMRGRCASGGVPIMIKTMLDQLCRAYAETAADAPADKAQDEGRPQ